MGIDRKTYVRFSYPGTLVDDYSTSEVSSREISQLKVPSGAFGFRFFDVLITASRADGEEIELRSDPFAWSPMFYYGGRIYTEAEVAAELPNSEILLSNMRGNDWNRVIQTRCGNFKPFTDEDILVEEA